MKDIKKLLFKTNAFMICKPNQPFWYDSGKIGLYYINAHYLYGSEKEATELLNHIRYIMKHSEKTEVPKDIFYRVLKHYNKSRKYSKIIDEIVKKIKEEIDINEVDYISGAEDKDWFFSIIVAYMLEKPHISLFKDMSAVISDSKFENNSDEEYLNGKVLHITDLVNQASNYSKYRNIIDNLGGKITYSFAVVDVMQGGTEILMDYNIEHYNLFQIDDKFFESALELGAINDKQLEMLKVYEQDPDGSMESFLNNHPKFLEDSLRSDKNIAEKARKCIDENIYNINRNIWQIDCKEL